MSGLNTYLQYETPPIDPQSALADPNSKSESACYCWGRYMAIYGQATEKIALQNVHRVFLSSCERKLKI